MNKKFTRTEVEDKSLDARLDALVNWELQEFEASLLLDVNSVVDRGQA
jgi:hypothetical protein